jgi:hypothetical protein
MVRRYSGIRVSACEVGTHSFAHGAVTVVCHTHGSEADAFESVWRAAEDKEWGVTAHVGGARLHAAGDHSLSVAMLLSRAEETCSDTLAVGRLRLWKPGRLVVFIPLGRFPGMGVRALLAGRGRTLIEALRGDGVRDRCPASNPPVA